MYILILTPIFFQLIHHNLYDLLQYSFFLSCDLYPFIFLIPTLLYFYFQNVIKIKS